MPDSTGPCRRCGRTVPRTATVCRACGLDADPERNGRGRALFVAVAGALAVLPATLPASPLALWRALAHHRALDGLVAS